MEENKNTRDLDGHKRELFEYEQRILEKAGGLRKAYTLSQYDEWAWLKKVLEDKIGLISKEVFHKTIPLDRLDNLRVEVCNWEWLINLIDKSKDKYLKNLEEQKRIKEIKEK